MSIIVPGSVATLISQTEEQLGPLEGIAFSGKLRASLTDPGTLTDEERKGAWAEIEALRFQPREDEERFPWGSYFGPMASAVRADGKEVFFPDAADIDTEILAHWQSRTKTTRHPVLRARYSDLVWEFTKKASQTKPDILFARLAIDSYLEIISKNLSEGEHQAWRSIARAIELALSISDIARIAQTKSVLLDFHRRQLKSDQRFMWWKLDDLAWSRKGLPLTAEERQEILDGLEGALSVFSNDNGPNRFDPHAALSAADRLVLRRKQLNQPDQAIRAMKTAGAAFENISVKASGMLAIAWLQDILRRYRELGLTDDAARVEATIRARSVDAKSEMKRIETKLDIKQEEFDAWLDQMTAGTCEETLARIAMQFLIKEDSTREMVLQIAKNAPLTALIPIDIVGPEGFTAARIGSVESDLAGRVIHQAADLLSHEASWLDAALTKARERHALDVEKILSFVTQAPFFDPSRHSLIREGIAAWFSGDHLKAIHVLVPQVEAALREILRTMGAPVMRLDREGGGFEAIGMGHILHSPVFQQYFDKNARLHFRALYCDVRGLNLRNQLAHGLMRAEQIGQGLANWVIHSLLLLGCLRAVTCERLRKQDLKHRIPASL